MVDKPKVKLVRRRKPEFVVKKPTKYKAVDITGAIVIDDVPVVKAGETVTNWAAIAAAIAGVAAIFSVPLDQVGVNKVLDAIGVIAAIVVWIRNKYFRKSVTVTSLAPKQLKAMRRV